MWKRKYDQTAILFLKNGYRVGQSGQTPMNLVSSVTILSVSGFNEDRRVISMNIHLAMVWNDTRLSIESNKNIR